MPKLNINNVKRLLDERLHLYYNKDFIKEDPISIPHQYSLNQDIELAGFFAAIFAWGNRKSIINSATRLLELMDHAPYDFIINHKEKDLKHMLGFVHRTFNATDLLYFIHFLQFHYRHSNSLENAFMHGADCKERLINFKKYFFSLDHPERTKKHIADPGKNSSCKRLVMYLRWMVRNDKKGVDFGIWKEFGQNHLMIPLDVHVASVSYKLGILPDKRSNWNNVEMLTRILRSFNAEDPVIYDYALFSLGRQERF